MKIASKNLIFLPIAFALSGCSYFDDSIDVKLYQCKQSAYHLDINSTLMRSAVDWKSPQLVPPPESRQELLDRLNKINLTMSSAMNGNGSMDRDKLGDWYKSDFCQGILKEYQDHAYGSPNDKERAILEANKGEDAALLRQVQHFSKSMADRDSKEVSCNKFKEQYSMTYANQSTSSEKYREQLEQGLRSTINDSTFKLKKYQVESIAEEISGQKIRSVASNMNDICADDKLLSDRIAKSDAAQYAQSKKTRILSEKSQALDAAKRDVNKECGDLQEIFCVADIRRTAAELAYAQSRECDDKQDSASNCSDDAEEMYRKALLSTELGILNAEKKKREIYINDPAGSRIFNAANALRGIDMLAEECQQQAVKNGMKGAAFQAHSAAVCVPNATREFLKPQMEELGKIKARLEALQGTNSSAGG